MYEFLSKLFDGTDFPARWHCGSWTDAHGWLHIISDFLIFGAYLAIPLVLAYFVKRQPNLPFPRIFWLFCAFIVACGFTHLNEVIIFWHPMYRWAGVMKAVTACVSWATVLSLFLVIPEALALRTPASLEAEVERRTAELRAAEDRFRRVVESAPNAMVMVDANRNITLVNQQTERLFKYSRDELLGQSIEALVPESARAEHPENVRGFMARPAVRDMGANRDLHALRKDGTEVPVEIGLTPVDTPEGPHVLASIMDITERKAAEAERERLIADLRSSNEELAQFAYVASHDLQEPLRTVVSFTELLDKRYADELDEKGQKYLDYIVDGGTRMSELISDLLAFSRVGTHGKPMEPVDVGRVVGNALKNLESAIAESEAEVLHDDLPTVRGDEIQLTQLFQNLVSNAIKFRNPDVTPRVEILVENDGPEPVFVVRDNGIGIAREYHDVVMRPFQRLSAPSATSTRRSSPDRRSSRSRRCRCWKTDSTSSWACRRARSRSCPPPTAVTSSTSRPCVA